jgi:hypothetical protein
MPADNARSSRLNLTRRHPQTPTMVLAQVPVPVPALAPAPAQVVGRTAPVGVEAGREEAVAGRRASA